jgi:peptide subunit release factor 1 (eRF1)
MAPIANRFSSDVRRAQPAAALPTVRAVVDRLMHIDPRGHWVVSCYLKLEPRDRARGKYGIKLKNRIKTHQAWLDGLGLGRGVREAIERDLARVRDYLADPGNLPTGRGIAIFAAEPLDLFEAIPLPEVFRSRLAVDHTLLVRELAALDDEFGSVLCAVYDRTSARLFEVTAFGVEELGGLAAVDATRAGRFHGTATVSRPGPGMAVSGEHNFNQRIRVEKQRHYAQIAQSLFAASRERAVRGLVLAGPGAEAGALTPHLHPYAAKLLLGTARLNPKTATVGEVMEAVITLRRAREREWEQEHVRKLGEGLGNGWAVNGVAASLAALARGQVRTLLVDAGCTQPGYRCRGSGRLAVTAEACADEGGAEGVPDVIDDAIEDALRQQAHLDVVEDVRARREVDGLAALLRFK